MATMPVGSDYNAESTALLIDEDWTCYLRSDAQIVHAGFLSVRREADGYHVTIQIPVKLGTDRIRASERAKLIPVESITGAD